MVSTVLTPFFQCFLNVLTLNGATFIQNISPMIQQQWIQYSNPPSAYTYLIRILRCFQINLLEQRQNKHLFHGLNSYTTVAFEGFGLIWSTVTKVSKTVKTNNLWEVADTGLAQDGLPKESYQFLGHVEVPIDA